MHKELIVSAFKQAKKNEQSKGLKSPSDTHIATVISEYMSEKFGFPFGNRRLKDYYNLAINEENIEDINISQLKVVEGLCKYLGYNSYEDFVLKNCEVKNDIAIDVIEQKKDGKLKKSNKLKITIAACIIVLICIVVITSMNQQQWMIWNEDHYEEAPFNQNQLSKGDLKIYKEERIKNFKKITPNCNTVFFKTDGTESLWYGKNSKGVLEYFTDLGLHPETGKTLKKITTHMIKKHICDTYN